MVNIPEKSTAPYTSATIGTVNSQKIQSAYTSQSIAAINCTRANATNVASNAVPGASTVAPATQVTATSSPARPVQQPSQPAYSSQVSNAVQPAFSTPVQASQITVPVFKKDVFKGQKIPLSSTEAVSKIKIVLGWNVTNPECDVDVSAFLLDKDGKCPGESWFVFYGHTESQDYSTVFSDKCTNAREIVTVDFTKLHPGIKKIVFVLTINDAFTKHLNFSMLKDTYLQILDANTGNELCSYLVTDYYANICSMMIGEVYEHNGQWKFNAVGNGVSKDLAGLCEMYGIQTC